MSTDEDVRLTDEERQILVLLVTKAWVETRYDPELQRAAQELESILRKINSVDALIYVRKQR